MPSRHSTTLSFLKQFLKGKKKLLRNKEINMIPKIPRIKEIEVRTIWEDIRNEESVAEYFPDSMVLGKRLHFCSYLFTVGSKKVIATKFPDAFKTMIKIIADNRESKLPEEEKLEILPDLVNELTSKKKFLFDSRITRHH